MIVNNLKNLYMGYLITSIQLTTCTGLSKVLDGSICHNKFTRLLSSSNFTSKTLWQQSKVIEQYHKEVKQIAFFGKSPTKTVKMQSNHFYLSIMAYSKVEILKIRTKINAFALKDKIYYNVLKHAMK